MGFCGYCEVKSVDFCLLETVKVGVVDGVQESELKIRLSQFSSENILSVILIGVGIVGLTVFLIKY